MTLSGLTSCALGWWVDAARPPNINATRRCNFEPGKSQPCHRLVPHWFSPAATSWGHSKCRGRLARDGPSPRIAAVRLGPWVQSEAPRLSLGRGGEPRAHSVPRSRISTPSFERHRGHNTASRPYSIAARLLKRDLVAIPSGQLNTPLRAGSRQALPPLAASPARSRSPQIQCARILRPARTPTPPPPLMRPQRRAATCAPHATARSDAYPSAVARRLMHITLVILCRRRLGFGSPMRHGARRRAHARRRAGGELHGIRRGVGVDHGVPRRKTHAVRRLKCHKTSEAVSDS